ncbi:hypothetical protein Tco_1429549 [Tanacetum coccineum]
MPYLRFTNFVVKYVMSKNDQIPKRPLSFQHVIKLDATLGNLKFANKGTIDPVFGMAIPAVMLNDNIKASAEYSEYLTKAGGSILVVRGCKGLLSKKGVEIAVEQIIEPLVRHRSNGVIIVSEAYKESKIKEERVDHSKKLKGLETLSEAAQLKLDLKKAWKASKDEFYIQQRSKGSSEGSGITLEVPDELVHKSSNEGARVNPEVPDESSNSSNNPSFDFEFAVEDISSDKHEVTEKVDNAKITNTEKDTEHQVVAEQVAKK